MSRRRTRFSSFNLLVSLSASSRPITALLRAASLSRRRWAASLLRLLNWATFPCTSEEVLIWPVAKVSRRLTRSDGRDGDWGRGRGWRLARSGETAKRGVPGEGGMMNLGSMLLHCYFSNSRRLLQCDGRLQGTKMVQLQQTARCFFGGPMGYFRLAVLVDAVVMA